MLWKRSPGRRQIERLVAFEQRIDVDQHEPADIGLGGQRGDGTSVLWPVIAGRSSASLAKYDSCTRRSTPRIARYSVHDSGCRIGDVGHRVVGPIEAESERTARMLQGKVRERAAIRQRAGAAQRFEVKRRRHGKNRFREQVLADGGQLIRRRRGRWCWASTSRRYDIDQIGEPRDVVEVGVREKDIQPIGLQMLADPAHAGAGIEHDADFREHQAGRLTVAVGK